jgi:hypothetical protein
VIFRQRSTKSEQLRSCDGGGESIEKGGCMGWGGCTSGVTCVDLGCLTVECELGCVLDATDLLTEDGWTGRRGDDSGEQGA